MTIIKDKVEVVLVGLGWTGSIYGQELVMAGKQVLALERGPMQDTGTDGKYPQVIDELSYAIRGKLFQDLSRETVTIRHKPWDTAVPYRQHKSFLLGNGVGGAGYHWNGMHYRNLPEELELKTRYTTRYGSSFIPEDMTIQDYGVTYDELEAFYTKFENVCGTSGKAGNLNHKIVEGGNPLEGWRSTEFPNKPLKNAYSAQLFAKAAQEMGYNPYPAPSSLASDVYTNPYGVRMGPCNFCGFCERFGCYMYSKASPQTTILPVLLKHPNFEVRTHSYVTRVNMDESGKKATGVTYYDAQGQEVFQPADLVVLNAYGLHNVRLLMLSGIGEQYDPHTGKGTLGKNYAYQRSTSVQVLMPEGTYLNPFIGTGAAGMGMDNLNGDQFDHSDLGFVGGASIRQVMYGGRPISMTPTPKGAPSWGSGWKKGIVDGYQRRLAIGISGSVAAYRDCYLDLDPTYKDSFGLPLLRMTFDWHENENKMVNYLGEKMLNVAKAMNPEDAWYSPVSLNAHYNTRVYQTTHNTGGAIMGADPSSSVVNKYSQHWDVPNLFVSGASTFPQNMGYNPTGLVGALAYFSVHNIIEQYLNKPGPMIQM